MSHDAELAARTMATPRTAGPSGAFPERTGSIHSALAVAREVLLAIVFVLCIPLVILAIGAPIALAMRLLLWLGGLL